LEKITQFLKKVAKTVAKILNPKNYYNKPCFETAYIGENVKNLQMQKSSPKCHHIFGLLHLFKEIPISFQK
jgi:hypothetical protein